MWFYNCSQTVDSCHIVSVLHLLKIDTSAKRFREPFTENNANPKQRSALNNYLWNTGGVTGHRQADKSTSNAHVSTLQLP